MFNKRSRLLADGHFPLYLRPYDQRPDQFIKKAFLPDYATQEDLARFGDEQMALKGFLERVTFYLGDRRLIIFLDQFEEFFSELPPEEQEAFAQLLRECAESDLLVWWVLALRKEYFSDLRLFSALKPFENEYFLPTFELEEAQEVVVEPAALKNVGYEAVLVDQILEDIRHGSDSIPPAQVQLVCYTLFDDLLGNGSGAEITFDLYNEPRGRAPGAPGAEGILTSHLSRVLDRELKGKERKVAGLVLEELVTSDVRRVMRGQEELLEALDPEQAPLLAPVLKALYDSRLVRRELDENDKPVYELPHDYLLNEIELDPETQARKAAQELLNQEVHAYKQHGTLLNEDKFAIINNQHEYLQIDGSAAELLEKSEETIKAERRRELEQAEKLAEEQRLRAEEAEAAAVAQRKSSTRLRRLVIGLVFILVLALSSASFAMNQWLETQQKIDTIINLAVDLAALTVYNEIDVVDVSIKDFEDGSLNLDIVVEADKSLTHEEVVDLQELLAIRLAAEGIIDEVGITLTSINNAEQECLFPGDVKPGSVAKISSLKYILVHIKVPTCGTYDFVLRDHFKSCAEKITTVLDSAQTGLSNTVL